MESEKSICFLVYSWDYLDRHILNFKSISGNPEDFHLCVARERCQEIEICDKSNFSYFFMLHKNHKMTCSGQVSQSFWNEYELFDSKREVVDSLSGHSVLLRSSANEIQKPLEFISGLSAKNIVTWEDEIKILGWTSLVGNEFTKREIRQISLSKFYEEIDNSFPSLKEMAGEDGKLFIKTRNKFVNFIIDINSPHSSEEMYSFETIPLDSQLIVSSHLDILSDKKGKLEYRIWVANYNPSSISRYLDYDISYPIPKEVHSFAEEFIIHYRDKLPSFYVLDIGLDRNKGPVAIELNGIIASGRYAENDFGKFLENIKEKRN